MLELRFEWDANKALANRRMHGVAFDEAVSVFYDECGLLIRDPDHSADEDRFLLLGLSTRLRLLIVCHCCRGPRESIRIISARKADRREQSIYNRRRRP